MVLLDDGRHRCSEATIHPTLYLSPQGKVLRDSSQSCRLSSVCPRPWYAASTRTVAFDGGYMFQDNEKVGSGTRRNGGLIENDDELKVASRCITRGIMAAH